MKVLIASGSGFIGSALAKNLNSAGHLVWIQTRHISRRQDVIHWDGETKNGWLIVLLKWTRL